MTFSKRVVSAGFLVPVLRFVVERLDVAPAEAEADVALFFGELRLFEALGVERVPPAVVFRAGLGTGTALVV